MFQVEGYLVITAMIDKDGIRTCAEPEVVDAGTAILGTTGEQCKLSSFGTTLVMDSGNVGRRSG